MNKKGIAIAVLLMVLTSIFLSGLSLIYFFSVNNNIEERIDMHTAVDGLLIREKNIDVMLTDIFEKSVKDFNPADGEPIFLDNIKRELDFYKDKKGNVPSGLDSIYEQLKEGNVELTPEKILFTVEIDFLEEKSDIKIDYRYIKRFEKIFK